ncbi:LysE family translocator [Oceanospirillum sediminis]|uniref:LysE family translocator n=1 Tax=Oceanospirillum sediminis TaxID=2760088 RepID=A0A839IW25_9GAMM|nr:LysE family translocator [Oceanospirillum sediminis]MBB1488880.1 LysE family translocator [Oceanospirillum sediminis]
MNAELWWLFFLSYFFITLAPGPNVFFVVQNAVKHGYMQAILSIMGNLSCQAVIIFLVAMGAGAMLEQSPIAFFILKIMGGLYLIYLGVTGLMKKPQTTEKTEPALVQQTSFFKTGFLVSASNPKTVIFLSAFLPQFISADYPVSAQFSVMFLTICAIVISVHLAYSYSARNMQKFVANTRAGKFFSRIYNGVFIAFGGGLIFSNK